MAFEGLPFNSKDEAVDKLKSIGFETDEAKEIAGILQEEAEMDEGNAKELYENLKEKAEAFISGLGLETFSWVGNPSQPSKFVMMKSAGGQFNSSSPILKDKQEDEWETIYAPVMQPAAVDKDGDVIPASVIKDAAHEFLATGKTDQIDSDHNLITGKGKLVESWILKEDKEYELPNGEIFEVPKGSWMVGVQPTDEVKERIESGELTGFSIFGEAQKIEVKNQTFKNKRSSKTHIEDNSMGENDNSGEDIGLKDVAETIESVKEGLDNLSDEVSELKNDNTEPEAKEVTSVEELKEALSSDGSELVELSMEADSIELSEGEDEGEEKQGDLREVASDVADMIGTSTGEVLEVLEQIEDEEEDGDEEEKGEEDEETEKEAKTDKGADEEEVRKSQLENKNEGGGLSFQKKAEKSLNE